MTIVYTQTIFAQVVYLFLRWDRTIFYDPDNPMHGHRPTVQSHTRVSRAPAPRPRCGPCPDMTPSGRIHRDPAKDVVPYPLTPTHIGDGGTRGGVNPSSWTEKASVGTDHTFTPLPLRLRKEWEPPIFLMTAVTWFLFSSLNFTLSK